MMKFYICLVVLISAVIFDSANGKCSLADCQDKVSTTGTQAEMCKSYPGYISCLEANIINDETCDSLTQTQAQNIVTSFKSTQQLLCGANTSGTTGKCDITACSIKPVTGTAAVCKSYPAYISCLENNIAKNDACSPQVKTQYQTVIDTTRTKLLECAGAAGLVSSLFVTLWLSGLAYLLTSFK